MPPFYTILTERRVSRSPLGVQRPRHSRAVRVRLEGEEPVLCLGVLGEQGQERLREDGVQLAFQVLPALLKED